MKPQEKLSPKGNRAYRYALIALLALALAYVCGCPQLREWRDQQIETSHSLSDNPQALPLPTTPVNLPRDVERCLPSDSTFTVMSYSNSGDIQYCMVLSTKGLEDTVQWVLAGMQLKGYTLNDNPSRVLEGVEFQSESAKYCTIKVKVEQNSAAQVLITYELTE